MKCPFRRMRRLRTLHCVTACGLFLATKKRCTKEKGTDTFPSENGKQYKYPRPLMHLRLSICFYSDESKALENCQKRKTSCGSLQGSDSCRISISHEGLMKVTWTSHESDIRGILPTFEDLPKILGVMKVL